MLPTSQRLNIHNARKKKKSLFGLLLAATTTTTYYYYDDDDYYYLAKPETSDMICCLSWFVFTFGFTKHEIIPKAEEEAKEGELEEEEEERGPWCHQLETVEAPAPTRFGLSDEMLRYQMDIEARTLGSSEEDEKLQRSWLSSCSGDAQIQQATLPSYEEAVRASGNGGIISNTAATTSIPSVHCTWPVAPPSYESILILDETNGNGTAASTTTTTNTSPHHIQPGASPSVEANVSFNESDEAAADSTIGTTTSSEDDNDDEEDAVDVFSGEVFGPVIYDLLSLSAMPSTDSSCCGDSNTAEHGDFFSVALAGVATLFLCPAVCHSSFSGGNSWLGYLYRPHCEWIYSTASESPVGYARLQIQAAVCFLFYTASHELLNCCAGKVRPSVRPPAAARLKIGLEDEWISPLEWSGSFPLLPDNLRVPPCGQEKSVCVTVTRVAISDGRDLCVIHDTEWNRMKKKQKKSSYVENSDLILKISGTRRTTDAIDVSHLTSTPTWSLDGSYRNSAENRNRNGQLEKRNPGQQQQQRASTRGPTTVPLDGVDVPNLKINIQLQFLCAGARQFSMASEKLFKFERSI
ncbi:hypothetical protein DAPPUDRAFT_242009 [Daphnia pulex]|uniref:Uncharacterized protein n=1 Tax=Daphnia pulex TaxID=6669 RepID=E9GFL9_DAPPU|nr:hypothetical protein DAPPUDRAFT_242009 [Daphnia pulex]|eukprot:EFX81783.1 hypothetical protein DAPPUDRAFT_242009 [Daphnia pulex]